MVDVINLEQAIARIADWCQHETRSCRFVVTPNLDHAVLLQTHEGLRAAYSEASLIIADGMPMIWANRLIGGPLRERVAGSDLIPKLFSSASAGRPFSVFLLGAAPGVAERAAHNIHERYPFVKVVGTYSPDLGFERNPEECEKIVAAVNASEPDVLVVGFGAPKQELWTHAYAPKLNAKVAICSGATIDFMAGHRRRAPRWMQKTGSEWVYRSLTEPRRLLPRYLNDLTRLPGLVYEDWKAKR